MTLANSSPGPVQVIHSAPSSHFLSRVRQSGRFYCKDKVGNFMVTGAKLQLDLLGNGIQKLLGTKASFPCLRGAMV